MVKLAWLYLQMGRFQDSQVVVKQAYDIRIMNLGDKSKRVKELEKLMALADNGLQ